MDININEEILNNQEKVEFKRVKEEFIRKTANSKISSLKIQLTSYPNSNLQTVIRKFFSSFEEQWLCLFGFNGESKSQSSVAEAYISLTKASIVEYIGKRT